MNRRTNNQLNVKEQMLKLLFVHRNLNAYQLYFLLNNDTIPMSYPIWDNSLINMNKVRSNYNQLSQLEKLGFIMESSKVQPRQYTLTAEGLSQVYQLFDIPEIEGFIRPGWDQNYGYFPYELFKPTSERLQKHHQLTTDFHILMRMLSHKYNFKYDFIDNRYAAVPYDVIKDDYNTSRIFRPDGEIKIQTKTGTKHFWLEIDMGTEKSNLLTEKFEKYAEYLDYISVGVNDNELANTMPDGIIFLTKALRNIWARNQNVYRSFKNSIGRWDNYLNLIVTNLETAENVIMSVLEREKNWSILNEQLLTFIQDRRFKGQPNNLKTSFCSLHQHEIDILGFQPRFTIVNGSQMNSLLLYINYEQYETNGLSKALHFFNMVQTRKIDSIAKANIGEIIPVLLFNKNKPKILSFEGCNEEGLLKEVFRKHLWCELTSNAWYDMNAQLIDLAQHNPLLYYSQLKTRF